MDFNINGKTFSVVLSTVKGKGLMGKTRSIVKQIRNEDPSIQKGNAETIVHQQLLESIQSK